MSQSLALSFHFLKRNKLFSQKNRGELVAVVSYHNLISFRGDVEEKSVGRLVSQVAFRYKRVMVCLGRQSQQKRDEKSLQWQIRAECGRRTQRKGKMSPKGCKSEKIIRKMQKEIRVWEDVVVVISLRLPQLQFDNIFNFVKERKTKRSITEINELRVEIK